MVHDPLFYKTMKDEAVALINHQFLDSLKKETPRMAGIKTRAGLAESSLKITKEILLSGNADEVVYPVVMRIKEMLMLEYIFSGRKYSTKALKKDMLGSGITPGEFSVFMDIYRASRANKKPEKHLSLAAVEKLVSILEMKIQHVKKQAEKRH